MTPAPTARVVIEAPLASPSPVATQAAQPENGAPPRKGVDQILRLGGSVIFAALIWKGSSFLWFLTTGPDHVSDSMAWFVYVAYAVNCLRQFYGLAIVIGNDKSRYTTETLLGLVSLIAVMAGPVYLLVYMEHAKEVTTTPDSAQLLYAYLGVAFAYVIWDTLTYYKDIYRKGETRGWAMIFLASLCVAPAWLAVLYIRDRLGLPCALVIGALLFITLEMIVEGVVHFLRRKDMDFSSARSVTDALAIICRSAWSQFTSSFVNADNMRAYVLNWKWILLFALVVGAIIANRVKSIPCMVGWMCATYTTLDLVFNRKFYFVGVVGVFKNKPMLAILAWLSATSAALDLPDKWKFHLSGSSSCVQR